jgi:hypothetical protein
MNLLPIEQIQKHIYFIREHKVMLDSDLAKLYAVPTKSLNLAVQRNRIRFPEDFMFQLAGKELENLRFQIETSRWGGRRYRPYVFTEQGVAMLSSVLKSERAALVNIAIMRAFVRVREFLATHKELARELKELEKKYDAKFRVVFKAIRALMNRSATVPKSHRLPPVPKVKGFSLKKG